MTTPTPNQIADAAKVLAKIKANDHTFANPDAAMALAWAECFAEYNLQLPDLLAGVTKLFADDQRTSRDRVLPGDVIAKARAIRRTRAEHEKSTQSDVDQRKLSAARQAIEACGLCDPNGWISTGTAVTRCDHQQQIAG